MTPADPPGDTLPLFDDDALPPPPPVRVDPDAPLSTTLARTAPGGGTKARAQLAFERLVASVEQARGELQQWREAIERYRSRHAAEVEPEAAALATEQRRMVALLDTLLADEAGRPKPERLGRTHRGMLKRLLIDLVGALLEEGHDPALVAIHDRHAATGHAEARALEMARTRAMLEETFGVPLGDAPTAETPDELIARVAEQLHAREAEAQQAKDARRAARARAKAEAAGTSPPPTAAAKRAAQAEDASRSMRDAYRQLASVLHPDREADIDERARKTRLMQRVNDAYAAKDLLALLELQLEAERFDATRLGALSEQRLGHYSRLLRTQLKELEDEIADCSAPFRPGGVAALSAAWDRRGPGTPSAIVDGRIDAEVAGLHEVRQALGRDLIAFGNPATLRQALQRGTPPAGDAEPVKRTTRRKRAG